MSKEVPPKLRSRITFLGTQSQDQLTRLRLSSGFQIVASRFENFAYSIAMAGVIQMTRELSTEWASRGVRVNAIAPAQITNPAFEERMNATPGLRENFLTGIPIGRLGVPEDIKGLALFLASDASSFMTGTVFPLDGGNLGTRQ